MMRVAFLGLMMRVAVFGLLGLLGFLSGVTACSRSPAPAPTSSPVASMPAVASADAAIPFDGVGGMGIGQPIASAELERFAREAAAIPPGKLQKPPPLDPKRDEAIRGSFGNECVLERTCGALWGINCRAEVDGPYFYVRPQPTRLEVITTCGGACMGGRCTNCPPTKEGWTCPVY